MTIQTKLGDILPLDSKYLQDNRFDLNRISGHGENTAQLTDRSTKERWVTKSQTPYKDDTIYERV